MVFEESIVSFARSKQWLQKGAAEKQQQCARASSRRGRRSTPSQPAESLLSSGLVGCSLCCARARHAEAVSSGRRQRRCISSVLGHRAGFGDRAGSVWTRARAVRGGAFPCASRPSDGSLARARRVRLCGRCGRPWARESRPKVLGWDASRLLVRRTPSGRSVSGYVIRKVGHPAGVPRAGQAGTACVTEIVTDLIT